MNPEKLEYFRDGTSAHTDSDTALSPDAHDSSSDSGDFIRSHSDIRKDLDLIEDIQFVLAEEQVESIVSHVRSHIRSTSAISGRSAAQSKNQNSKSLKLTAHKNKRRRRTQKQKIQSTAATWLWYSSAAALIMAVGFWASTQGQPQGNMHPQNNQHTISDKIEDTIDTTHNVKDPRIAAVLHTQNPCTVTRHGTSLSLRTGAALYENDLIHVDQESQFNFIDSSTITLTAHSRFQLVANAASHNTGIHLLTGSLHAQMRKQSRSIRFSDTRQYIEILGTEFTVTAQADISTIHLHEGSIRVHSKTDNRLMQISETLSVNNNGAIVVHKKESEWQTIALHPDLTAWDISRGNWTVNNGILQATSTLNNPSRIENKKTYTSYQLRCKIRGTDLKRMEIQFHDYSFFAAILGKSINGVHWHQLQLSTISTAANKKPSVSIDGKTVNIEHGTHRKDSGSFAFFTNHGGTLLIKDIEIRIIE